MCVYNIYSHPSFHPLLFFLFLCPLFFPSHRGEIYASLPRDVATAAEAEKEKGLNGVNKIKNKKKRLTQRLSIHIAFGNTGNEGFV